MAAFAYAALILLIVWGIIWLIRSGGKRSNGFAALTAFHDFQTKDVQHGVETVIERQAEKKWDAEERGSGSVPKYPVSGTKT